MAEDYTLSELFQLILTPEESDSDTEEQYDERLVSIKVLSGDDLVCSESEEEHSDNEIVALGESTEEVGINNAVEVLTNILPIVDEPSPEPLDPVVTIEPELKPSHAEIEAWIKEYFIPNGRGYTLFHYELLTASPERFEAFLTQTLKLWACTAKPGFFFLTMLTQTNKAGVSLLAQAVQYAHPKNLALLLNEALKQKNNGAISLEEYTEFLTLAKDEKIAQ